MTLTNREVFVQDPTERDIPNLGVAKVKRPEDLNEWATLEWELASFVCEGEYERGLGKILDQFLSHLGQAQQPAVWISGFFGSGKSHLVRVLEYMWRDYQFTSGASARSLAQLPADIQANFTELSVQGKREGGLWSVAGTLGSGASGSVRLAFLGLVFDAAGLPQQYAPGRLALWLKQEGHFDQVRAGVEAQGHNFERELQNLYVSPWLADALIESGAFAGATRAAVSETLQVQFPIVKDIGNDEAVDLFEQVLALQSTSEGKLPLTLVVWDELQQYINDDNDKANHVQELVEACSAKLGSRVLFVATGQAALTATPTLQKLIDRFSVNVALSDTDVETVVRKVVLQKKPSAVKAVEGVLSAASGEIDRQLNGTRLEAKGTDQGVLVADYPLLPTRRRFWERALRAVDRAGKAGVLRTQLRIVHEAVRTVADRPLGHAIGADFVFRSESAAMVQSGALLKEIDELIRDLEDGTPDGDLKSRACALVFLIGHLPREGGADLGVRATSAVIADLLVEDLTQDGTRLRRDVPRLMEELVEAGRVVKLGDEFHLQTQEGAEWTKDFNQNRAAIVSDAARMSTLRHEWLQRVVGDQLAGLKLVQGKSATARRLQWHWGDDEPVTDGSSVPVWVHDEWGVTEARAREAANAAGSNSATVFVFLPKIGPESIRDALAGCAAAQDTINQRAEPHTDEGRQAKQGMQNRVTESERLLTQLFEAVAAKARVFQGGGNELSMSSLRDGVEKAARNALIRLFPKFNVADDPGWRKAGDQAREGASDALAAVGWPGEVAAHPVCKEVLARTSGAGTKGSELERQLGDPLYGWPKDAVDGALLVLLASGNVRAERDGHQVGAAKELQWQQVGKTVFYKEDEPPTKAERLAVRGVLEAAPVPYTANKEGAAISGLLQRLIDLAAGAGGPAPQPPPPDTAHIDALAALAGNQQVRAVAAEHTRLRQDIKDWSAVGQQRGQREDGWARLDRLLGHAAQLDVADSVRAQRDAIETGRLLLQSPDPVAPLNKRLCEALRAAVVAAAQETADAQTQALGELEASAEWQQIDAATKEALLAQVGLTTIDVPAVASDADLLQALDMTPLAAWAERRQAIQGKVAMARAAAAKKLEPKSVMFNAPAATIKTPEDVEAYLATLRVLLMQHVAKHETVII